MSVLRRGALAVGAASAAVMLTGCGLVGVRVATGDGGPVRISAQTTQGPEPVVEETEGPSTEGMEQLSLSLGSSCPARVSLYAPEDWTGSTSGGSYYGMPVDAGIDAAGVSVYCTTSFGDSAAEGVDSSRSYQFSDRDTEIVVEKTSPAGEGYYWAYQAELGEEEPLYKGEPTTVMGVIAHYPVSGQLYQVNVTFSFASDDQQTREYAAASLSHLTVEGASIAAPAWDMGG